MHTYNSCEMYSVYKTHWMLEFILPQDVKCPKPPRKLGRKRRYNNTTTPPLDFR